MEGKRAGETDLPGEVFGVPMNADLLHQAVAVLQSRRRKIVAHTKMRSEVRGGGRKPWQQKGTGRARHGSTRSPLWRGGGVTFGPRKERRFARELPDGMRRKAFAIALSQKFRDGEVIVLDALSVPEAKTKHMARALKDVLIAVVGMQDKQRMPSVNIALHQADGMVLRATRNLPFAQSGLAGNVDVLDLLSSRFLLFPKDAIPIFTKRVMRKKRTGKVKK